MLCGACNERPLGSATRRDEKASHNVDTEKEHFPRRESTWVLSIDFCLSPKPPR
jgi:hypothetical protein